MPIYEYKCGSCNLQFESLKKSSEGTETMDCVRCGKTAHRMVSVFSSKISGGTMKESVDMTIGREADRRWQGYYDRQSKRHGDRKPQSVEAPVSKDGKFMPVMGLGNTTEKTKRVEYVDALQEHRRKRIARGQPQFSGPGEF